MNTRTLTVLTTLAFAPATGLAQPADPPDPPAPVAPAPVEAPEAPAAPAPAPLPAAAPAAVASWGDAGASDEGAADSLQIHGWVSQGAILSTGNNYLASTKRGNFEFFDTGINVTQELGSNLRAGVQIFAQDLGPVGNYNPTVDWAYIDYRRSPSFGIRVGRFKMPLSLYSDRLDADMTRTTVLMPQSVYDQHYRDVLAAVTGLDLYGALPLGGGGSLDYDAYVGTLYIGPEVGNFNVDTLAGSRVVWNTPLKGLRLAGHVLYANFHQNQGLDAATIAGVQASGMAPAGWDGTLTTNFNDWTMTGGAVEYATETTTLTAELSKWRSDLTFSPMIKAPDTYDELRAYVQAEVRPTDLFSLATYVSIYRNATQGANASKPENHQYDAAVALRYDVTAHWLVKAEAHAISGWGLTEGSLNVGNVMAERWGLFLLKTTLSF